MLIMIFQAFHENVLKLRKFYKSVVRFGAQISGKLRLIGNTSNVKINCV